MPAAASRAAIVTLGNNQRRAINARRPAARPRFLVNQVLVLRLSTFRPPYPSVLLLLWTVFEDDIAKRNLNQPVDPWLGAEFKWCGAGLENSIEFIVPAGFYHR